jgi:hypothetical protein
VRRYRRCTWTRADRDEAAIGPDCRVDPSYYGTPQQARGQAGLSAATAVPRSRGSVIQCCGRRTWVICRRGWARLAAGVCGSGLASVPIDEMSKRWPQQAPRLSWSTACSCTPRRGAPGSSCSGRLDMPRWRRAGRVRRPRSRRPVSSPAGSATPARTRAPPNRGQHGNR